MTIAIFGKGYQDEYKDKLETLLSNLCCENYRVVVEAEFYDYLTHLIGHPVAGVERMKITQMSAGFAALALSIGGDGTFLRTADVMAPYTIPVLGVNTGSLGYLTEVVIDEAVDAVNDFFAGECVCERRTMLMAESDTAVLKTFALNEIAITKEVTSSMIAIETEVDGKYLATYQGDGLLVSTPTGSTAYNLSVGGPILAPSAPCWVLSPIATHSLTMRPLIIGDASVITVKPVSRSGFFRLSLDGNSQVLPSGTAITLRRSPFDTLVIRRKGYAFSSTLRAKLLWSR